jgi:hypothetical protein
MDIVIWLERGRTDNCDDQRSSGTVELILSIDYELIED